MKAWILAVLLAIGISNALTAQEILVIPIQAVRVADDDGGRQTHITPGEVAEWIRVANSIYAVANIQFEFDPLQDFTTIRSTVINSIHPDDPEWETRLAKANEVAANFAGKMTIFFRWGANAAPTGNGLSGWIYNFAALCGFFDTWHCGTQSEPILAHELGHHLGLPHPFGAAYGAVAEAEADFAARGNNPAIFEGDGFSDTPPFPTISAFECSGPSQIVLNGIVFSQPRGNLMSYYPGDGVPTLTPQQVERVRWMAAFYRRNNMLIPTNKGSASRIELEDATGIQAQGVFFYRDDMSRFSFDLWSHDMALTGLYANGGTLTIPFSVDRSGAVNLNFFYTLAPNCGRFQLYIDNVPAGAMLDAYAPLVLASGAVPIGRFNLAAGTHWLKVQSVGKNPLAVGYDLGLDCLTVTPDGRPAIIHSPATQTVGYGSATTLQVTAAGAAPLNIQWVKDGAELPGATNAILAIPFATGEQSGNYQAQVRNFYGNETSGLAQITVLDGPNGRDGRFEGEDLIVEKADNVSSIGRQDGGTSSGWSMDATLLIRGTLASSVETAIPIHHFGKYVLTLRISQAPDAGIYECSLDGMELGSSIDPYSIAPKPAAPIFLGSLDLEPGVHRLKFHCLGKNPLSSGYNFAIDYIDVTRQPNQQRMRGPIFSGAGVTIPFRPQDGTGADPRNANAYLLQKSLNLGEPWSTLLIAPTFSNGDFIFNDTNDSKSSYYRILER